MRIFDVRVTSADEQFHEDFHMPWTLLFSILTSVTTFGLAVLEIGETAAEQDMNFCQALADIPCVGLGWRAP